MADADHPIVCSKCKKPGTAEQSECASCGGRVVRVCGSCGFKNSAAKKYCDVCGENFAQSKAKAAEPPKPAPKPEAKAPPAKPAEPPKPAAKPEAKAPPPAPKPPAKPAEPPKPAPKIELPKPAPPEKKPEPPAQTPKPPMRLEEADAADKPAPFELKKREEPGAPPEKKPEPPREAKESKDEAMGRYIPKTIISRLPPRDAPRVERDDEAAITPPDKPSPPEKKPAPPERKAEPPDESWRAERHPEKEKPAELPPDKKERVKMHLESGNTPMPKPIHKPPEEKPKEPPDEPWRAERRPAKEKPAEASPDKKERVKMRLEGSHTPMPLPLPTPASEKPKEPAKAEKKPGELDPRLVKGYEPKKEEREKPREKERPPRRDEPSFARTMVRERPKAVFSTVLALFLLMTGAAVYVVKVKQRKSPSETLVKAAGDYLFALKQKDYAAAYGMLSTASRRAVTPEAFKRLQDESVWTFDDLRAEMVAQGWALVRYKLLVSGQQYEEDWLVLQYEGGQWRRAYWWPLQDDIEAALGRGDAAGAARVAHDAQVIDPLDPVPVSYTCEAAYMGGDSAAAADACGKAIKMTDTLPSRVGNDGLFRMRAILADIDRNVLKRPADAVQKYAILLQYPKLDDDQRCDLALARGEAELELAQSPAALEDFKTAQGSCRPAADQAYAARGVRILSGQAGSDAIAAVQAHRMPGDEQTVAEWRAKTRAELAKRLKTTAATLPAEPWAAEHKGGGAYAVTLTSGHDVILTAEADLFAGKLKVEMHVQ